MATADSVRAKLQNLIASANTATGRTDSDLTTSVNALIEGYGQGGSDAEKYIEAQHENVDLPNATSIKPYAFNNDSILRDISMPNVEVIGARAFNQCANLSITSLPRNLTSVGEYAFYDNQKLALTSLPDKLERIDMCAFYRCFGLTLSVIPSSVTLVNNNAFSQCKFTSMTFAGKPNIIGSNAFMSCTKLATINVPWAEGEVANAPWGATNATINYNYTGG